MGICGCEIAAQSKAKNIYGHDCCLPAHASVAVGTSPPASGRALGPHRPPPEAEVGGHDEEDEDERRPHDDEHGQDRRHRELAHLGQGALPRLRLGRPAQLLAARPLPVKKNWFELIPRFKSCKF